MNQRVGIGYDVHKLEQGTNLIIGGVKIKSEYGCVSHSDGDVLTHAVIDAILGACCKKDIGYYFPPTDQKYKDINSLILLKNILNIISDFQIVNLDCTVILQSPKLLEYREKIQENLATSCNISQEKVNIKFKTEEFLGFTGNMQGIKAIVVCLVEKLLEKNGAGNRT